MTSAALESLRRVALELGPELRDQVVFLGGAAAGLLVTETRGHELRPTDDVDVVADVASQAGFYALQAKLKERGFHEDPQAKVLCRFRRGELVLDLMPVDPRILGFSNRWYEYAIESASKVELAPAGSESAPITIRVVSASCFVATKLEAYRGRGDGDLYHADIEDIVTVIDGRPELLAELSKERADLREYVRSAMAELLAAGLEEKIAGLMLPDHSSQTRVPLVVSTCRRIAAADGRSPEIPMPLLPKFAFIWTVHVREGTPAGFYVNCWLEAPQRALQPFFKGNRPPIAIEALSDPLRQAVETIWAVAVPLITAHADVDPQQPYRRATDHLARFAQSADSTAEDFRLVWTREVDVPDGRVAGPNGAIALDAELAGALLALDAEAARVAAERIHEALAAKRVWDDV
jgi:hypothetical protein